MHLSKALCRLIAIYIGVCFIFLILFVTNTSAEDNLDSLVDANFDIEFITGTDLKISVTMDVSEITAFETTYGTNEIQDLAASVEYDDIIIMGGIMQTLHDLLKNQIVMTFENANVVPLNTRPTYEDTVFYEDYGVNLTSPFFSINETVNSHDLVNGVLDMDAIVYYVFSLHAAHGWNNTYTIILPEFMKYRSTTGSAENNRILWEVKNRDGQHPELPAEISIQLTEPTTPKLTVDDIRLEFELDTSNINSIALNTIIITKNVDLQEHDILPDFINGLDFVSSDGIRLFIDNGLLSWEDLYQKTIKSIEQNTITTIESSSFNQSLEMSFNWNLETTINCSTPYNITSMDDDPPIKAELIDIDVNLLICDMSSRAFFGLVNAGATANISTGDINFGDRLGEIGYPYDVFLHLPNNVSLEGKNIYSWNSSNPLSGEFVSDLRPIPEYSKENIDTLIEIDISNMDLDITSFFSGKTKLTATSYLNEENYIYVSSFPQEFKISDKINLTYFNSDAFRLCAEEDVFNEEDIDVFLTNKKDIFELRLSDILNNLEVKGVVDKDVFYNSLNWDGDISNMDNVVPITISTYAHNIYPVAFNLSFWPPEISISNQLFNLKGLEKQSVTYRITFPKGISVNAKDTLNKSLIKGKTNDGREYVELSFDVDEETKRDVVLCEIYASSIYILGLFLPCILSLVLVVILIIIVYLIRKKKKGRKITKDDTESTGYEDQDYYVPPPPSTK
ncbi:MAG: hypothetical protein JSW06_09860 [Thermoplasmatales archaeon]|nr:MAG: hypothetical protein JSW06_09860 [Thermoplasmatales archaeon]